MKYPKPLQKGDTIGICAPSSGAAPEYQPRLDSAIANIRAMGYDVIESPSLRQNIKCVSADAKTRADEFMELYKNPAVAAIIPPWGGEFAMDMLPFIDFNEIADLLPTWISGYSDISTLTFPLTILSDVATIHGSNLINLGSNEIHSTDLALFDAMSQTELTQQSAPFYGEFTGFDDISKPLYTFDKPNVWKTLKGEEKLRIHGRIIGGCMDTLCKLIGTEYAFLHDFLNEYSDDGFIWALESCEMSAADIYRTLWQMKQSDWFDYCKGVIYGRPDGYKDTADFAMVDALKNVFDDMDFPVIYDADVGHIPPIMQFINGAYAVVNYENGAASVRQIKK